MTELLRLENVTRRVNSEFYIRNIDLTLYRGEVLAFAGKNAAGKSVLAGVIGGSMPADSGRIWWEGREVRLRTPAEAAALGIMMMGQNNEGFPNLTVAENLLIGNQKYYKGSLSPRRMAELCRPALEELGLSLDPRGRFEDLTPAQRQLAGVARAYLSQAKLFLMDEPSSRLPEPERALLLGVVRRLREQGRTVVYVTHRLGEILEAADRVAFLDRGELRAVRPVAGMTELQLIEGIEGHPVESLYGPREGEPGPVRLELRDFSCGSVGGLDLDLRRGEVLSVLCGADSSGRDLCMGLAGLEPHGGTVRWDGEERALKSPREAAALRFAAAIDQRAEELLLAYGDGRGPAAAARARVSGSGWSRALQRLVGLDRLGRAEYRTGGYRQRELVDRVLARDADLYLLLEPTHGVDLQARMGLYGQVLRLCALGRSVLWLTTDAEEALGLGDRAAALGPGGLTDCRPAEDWTGEELAACLRESSR